jgi:hypothetical protein
LRGRQAEEYRTLEDDYRHRHQRMQEAHEKEIQVKKILIEGKNTLHDSVMFA